MAMSRSVAKEIFLDALDLPPQERAQFVEAAADGDVELQERVAKLLEAHSQADEVLEQSGSWLPSLPDGLRADELDPGSFATDSCEAGQHIGQFTLLERIGEGGFGRVWLAEQVSPVRRQVALKVLKSGLANAQVVHRFEAEQQALALMDHACIARVIDGGATEKGQPWLAMELVQGPPITTYCTDQKLGVRERLALFIQVCQAVQHAHQKGVVHRDLKPSNVLVALVEGRPVPKVIDFGIAKAVGCPLTASTLRTLDGQVMGTPAYMSPEQLQDSTDVDTRADVYSLGVLLYEMLSGTTPLEDATDESVGLLELLDVIRDVEPRRPSTRLGRDGAGGRSQMMGAIHAREVQGDLDWIVLRCLEKDRSRRYDSVAVLEMEIERHLNGDPVLAGPPTLRYRASKFARKHTRALAFATILFVSLVGGLLLSLAQMRRARAAEAGLLREAERTQVELERFETVAGFLEHLLLGVDPAIARGKDTELIESLLRVADQSIADEEKRPPEVEATLRRIIGGSYHSLALFDRAEEQLAQALDLRREALGELAPETLASRAELGGLYIKMQRYGEAEEQLQIAADGQAEVAGEGAERRMDVLSSMATLRKEQGQTEAAAELFALIEPWFIEHKGARHRDTLLVMNNFAGVLQGLGREEQALERYKTLVDAQTAVAGENDPRTLMALNNLGSAYLGLGRFDQAREPLERALGVKRTILPEGHPGLVPTLGNLGYLYRQLGDLEQALASVDEALEITQEANGPFSQQAVQLGLTRGTVLFDLGRYDQVIEEMRSIVDAPLEDLPGAGFLHVLARTTLARAFLGAGRAGEALDEARKAVEHVDEVAPEGHGVRSASRVTLGRALMELGRLDEAREELLDAFAELETSSSTGQRETCISALVDVHLRLDLPDEAAKWKRLVAE